MLAFPNEYIRGTPSRWKIQTTDGGGTMKHVKSISSSIFLVLLCVGVIWAENDLAVRFPMIFSIVSVSSLVALLHALHRAPAGYENEHGFHIRVSRKHVHPPRPVLATSGPRI